MNERERVDRAIALHHEIAAWYAWATEYPVGHPTRKERVEKTVRALRARNVKRLTELDVETRQAIIHELGVNP